MHRGRVPDGPYRQTIRSRASTYDVYRHTGDGSTSLGESPSDLSDSSWSALTSEVYVYDPAHADVEYPSGDREEWTARALALPSWTIDDEDVVDLTSMAYGLCEASVLGEGVHHSTDVIHVGLAQRLDLTL